MKRLHLISIFFLGLVLGLLLTLNSIAKENPASAQIDEGYNNKRLVAMETKLDQVLENQQVIFKELKRIFARIH